MKFARAKRWDVGLYSKSPKLLMEASVWKLHALTSIKYANKVSRLCTYENYHWITKEEWTEVCRLGTKFPLNKLIPLATRVMIHGRKEYLSEISSVYFWTTWWSNRGQRQHEAEVILKETKSIEFLKLLTLTGPRQELVKDSILRSWPLTSISLLQRELMPFATTFDQKKESFMFYLFENNQNKTSLYKDQKLTSTPEDFSRSLSFCLTMRDVLDCLISSPVFGTEEVNLVARENFDWYHRISKKEWEELDTARKMLFISFLIANKKSFSWALPFIKDVLAHSPDFTAIIEKFLMQNASLSKNKAQGLAILYFAKSTKKTQAEMESIFGVMPCDSIPDSYLIPVFDYHRRMFKSLWGSLTKAEAGRIKADTEINFRRTERRLDQLRERMEVLAPVNSAIRLKLVMG